MIIQNCTKEDFDQIIENLGSFWIGDDIERLKKIKNLHHPIMIYELGDNAFVIKDGEIITAYLLGLFSKTEPLAYVQFVATHKDYKHRGFATALYEHFIEKAKKNGCKFIKAITSVGNQESISFHKSIGMHLLGDLNENGIPLVRNYAGPGQDRVVFLKEII